MHILRMSRERGRLSSNLFRESVVETQDQFVGRQALGGIDEGRPSMVEPKHVLGSIIVHIFNSGNFLA